MSLSHSSTHTEHGFPTPSPNVVNQSSFFLFSFFLFLFFTRCPKVHSQNAPDVLALRAELDALKADLLATKMQETKAGNCYWLHEIIASRGKNWVNPLCQFLMKIIPVINWVYACVKTSVEDDNFPRESWGCVNLMIFKLFESFYVSFGLTEEAWFHEILGLLLVYADWDKGGVCLRGCMCACFMT